MDAVMILFRNDKNARTIPKGSIHLQLNGSRLDWDIACLALISQRYPIRHYSTFKIAFF